MRCVWIILSACLGFTGCAIPGQRADFSSTDPAERTLAVGRAAESPDPEAVPALILLLESEDPAERMLAIGALEMQTGQTLGYDYSDSEPRRAAAVQRWVAWQKARSGGPTAPATAPMGQ